MMTTQYKSLNKTKWGNQDSKYDTKSYKSTPKMPEVTLTSKATVVVSEEVNDKIIHICKLINNKEWSGLLLYSIEGDIDSPSNLVCTIRDIYVMDIGTSAHTQFKYDGSEIATAYMENEDWIINNYRLGLIHSHVDMAVFFSGEDMSELHDNSEGTDFYLSVVVNNANDIVAKIALRGNQTKEISTIHEYKTRSGKLVKLSDKSDDSKEVLVLVDCNIDKPVVIDTRFVYLTKRIEAVKEAKAKVVTPTSYGGMWGRESGWIDDFEYSAYPSKPSIPASLPATTSKSTGFKDPFVVERYLKSLLSKGFSLMGASYLKSVEESFLAVDITFLDEEGGYEETHIVDILNPLTLFIPTEDNLIKEVYINIKSLTINANPKAFIAFITEVIEYIEVLRGDHPYSFAMADFVETFELVIENTKKHYRIT
jgi:proteasome lid subunit RPN8/RPN11